MKNEIILFEEEGIRLEVNLGEETVWLTQKQLSELFDVQVPSVNKHILNLYAEKELEKSSTISKMEIVQEEGNRNVKLRRKTNELLF